MKNIAIFASGSGTNAERIIHFFRPEPDSDVKLILVNNPNAGVINRAKELGVPCFLFNRDDLYSSQVVMEKLNEYKIDFIVLAGFLWLVPKEIIKAYPASIINIHPALLPKYGGKGMYGLKVHETVITNGETESGISIHYVNELYDDGNIIFQAKCKVEESDTPESLAEKIHKLEYEHFPRVIKEVIKKL